MAERSKVLRSDRSLLWRRGIESHFWHVIWGYLTKVRWPQHDNSIAKWGCIAQARCSARCYLTNETNVLRGVDNWSQLCPALAGNLTWASRVVGVPTALSPLSLYVQVTRQTIFPNNSYTELKLLGSLWNTGVEDGGCGEGRGLGFWQENGIPGLVWGREFLYRSTKQYS